MTAISISSEGGPPVRTLRDRLRTILRRAAPAAAESPKTSGPQDELAAAVEHIHQRPETAPELEPESLAAETPEVEPPGTQVILTLVEDQVGQQVATLVPPLPALSILEKHASITGQMVDFLAERDRALGAQIASLSEERRQTRVVLRAYRETGRALAVGMHPKTHRAASRRRATTKSAAE